MFISLPHYGLEMLMHIALDGQMLVCSDSPSAAHTIACPISGDTVVTEVFGYAGGPSVVNDDAAGLFLTAVALRVLCWCVYDVNWNRLLQRMPCKKTPTDDSVEAAEFSRLSSAARVLSVLSFSESDFRSASDFSHLELANSPSFSLDSPPRSTPESPLRPCSEHELKCISEQQLLPMSSQSMMLSEQSNSGLVSLSVRGQEGNSPRKPNSDSSLSLPARSASSMDLDLAQLSALQSIYEELPSSLELPSSASLELP